MSKINENTTNPPSAYYKALDLFRFDFAARKLVREFRMAQKQCNRSINTSHATHATAPPSLILIQKIKSVNPSSDNLI